MELKCKFTPADGGPVRDITLRIGDPTRGPTSWLALVEIVGFDNAHAEHSQGEDWAQAAQLAAMVLPHALSLLVHSAGGGTIDPPFFARDAEFDAAKYPPEVLAVLGMAPDGSPLRRRRPS